MSAKIVSYTSAKMWSSWHYVRSLELRVEGLEPFQEVKIELKATVVMPGQSPTLTLGASTANKDGVAHFRLSRKDAMYDCNLAVVVSEMRTSKNLAVRPTMVSGWDVFGWAITHPIRWLKWKLS